MNIKNKTLKELKSELVECNDQPIRKALIKKLIEKKENELKTKNTIIKKPKNDVAQNNNNIVFSDKSDSEMDDDDTLNKLIEINTENNKYFQVPMDDKYKSEIDKDHTNNKLMDRMNSELDFRIRGKHEKVFDKPYTNIDDNFAIISDTDNCEVIKKPTSNANVNSKKILGQRKVIQ